MENSEVILNEKDPVLREIWAAGYTKIEEDGAGPDKYTTIRLYQGNELKKEFPLRDFQELCMGLKFINAILIDGSKYSWVSKADGSAERLHNFIGTP